MNSKDAGPAVNREPHYPAHWQPGSGIQNKKYPLELSGSQYDGHPGASQPYVIVVNDPGRSGPNTWDNYKTKQALRLGCIQIVCGILSIFFHAVALSVNETVYVDNRIYISRNMTWFFISVGIWGAIFYIIAGVFGVCASRRKTTCTIVTTMVMAILATVCAFHQIFFMAMAVANDATSRGESGHFYCLSGCSIDNDEVTQDAKELFSHKTRVSLAMGALLFVVGFVEFFVLVWSAALSCGAVCCGGCCMQQQQQQQQKAYIVNAPGNTVQPNEQLSVVQLRQPGGQLAGVPPYQATQLQQTA